MKALYVYDSIIIKKHYFCHKYEQQIANRTYSR